jgi:hypothetical protein
MERAVRAFAGYRQGPERWVLGRFVVPARRLGEFADGLRSLPAELRAGEPWPVAVLGGELGADLAAVAAFTAGPAGALAHVEAIEVPAITEAGIAAARAAVPPGLVLVLELPLVRDLPALARAVRAAGAVAKVRTGGVNRGDIPAPADVLRFLAACAGERVPMKATAGLHHAVRAEQPLTYEAGCARATMFGYLNVWLAALALWHGRTPEEARRILEEEDRRAFALGDDAVGCGAVRFSAEEVMAARRDFATAIGSCSVEEPVAEMRELGARLGSPA